MTGGAASNWYLAKARGVGEQHQRGARRAVAGGGAKHAVEAGDRATRHLYNYVSANVHVCSRTQTRVGDVCFFKKTQRFLLRC